MTKHHDPKRPGRVSEAAPVQVFLSSADRARLDRLTSQLGTSKSDVLRQSLATLERELLDPRTHPALRLIGLVADDDGLDAGVDLARAHDRYLAAREPAAANDDAVAPVTSRGTRPRPRRAKP